MTTDKKRVYILSISIFALLFLTLFIPNGSSRIGAAILLTLGGIAVYFLLKKRSIYSINKGQVLLVMAVMGLLYIALFYVSGLEYGYYKEYPTLSITTFFQYILPCAAIIAGSEVIRTVVLAQESKVGNVFAYLIGVLSEVLAFSGIGSIATFNRFMDVLGLYFFPAILSNLLYNYLAKRYGAYPNAVYRALTTLFIFFFSYASGVPDSMYAFVKLFIPLLIYGFIDALYEKKRKYALKKKSKFAVVGAGVFVCVLTAYVMLISCQFTFGMLIIGSESMTGEINKGDAIIYQEYDEQLLTVGEVIVFTPVGSKTKIVHRIVEIERVNGQNRYYTKGDANEERDDGYVTDGQIVGVTGFKIPYMGYPTLWIRSLF